MQESVDWLLDSTETRFRFAFDQVVVVDTPEIAITARMDHFERSGLIWFESVARTGEAGVTFVPDVPTDEPLLFLSGALEGSGGITMPDVGRDYLTTFDGLKLKRSREGYVVADIAPASTANIFGVDMTCRAAADWFGGRMPAELRPLLADTIDRSVDVPALDGRVFRALVARLSDFREPLRRFAAEGIAMQMISAALNALCGSAAVVSSLTAREARGARAARERLLADLRRPTPTGELAAIAGMTERRLDQAFRELFGASIFRTLSDARLDHAREVLLSARVPIKELAYRLGYAHASSFSHAFRARFGVFPTQLGR